MQFGHETKRLCGGRVIPVMSTTLLSTMVAAQQKISPKLQDKIQNRKSLSKDKSGTESLGSRLVGVFTTLLSMVAAQLLLIKGANWDVVLAQTSAICLNCSKYVHTSK